MFEMIVDIRYLCHFEVPIVLQFVYFIPFYVYSDKSHFVNLRIWVSLQLRKSMTYKNESNTFDYRINNYDIERL